MLGQPAVVAAQTIKDVANSGRADPSLSTDQEDQGRPDVSRPARRRSCSTGPTCTPRPDGRQDQRGDQDVFQNLGWAPYPAVYPSVPGQSSVGGANIGVSAYGPISGAATQAAICMTRSYWENQEAINEGLPPVTVTSYTNPAVIKAYPFAPVLLKQLEHATNRPETPLLLGCDAGDPADAASAAGSSRCRTSTA